MTNYTIENRQISVNEWCKTVFQEAWNKRYREEFKKQGKIPIFLYNPTWTFDAIEEYHKKACNIIRQDREFINSIAQPYNIKWEYADNGFFKFFREEEDEHE